MCGHMKYSRPMYNMKIMMTQINTRGVNLGLKCTCWDPKWPASITAVPGQVHTAPGRPSGSGVVGCLLMPASYTPSEFTLGVHP